MPPSILTPARRARLRQQLAKWAQAGRKLRPLRKFDTAEQAIEEGKKRASRTGETIFVARMPDGQFSARRWMDLPQSERQSVVAEIKPVFHPDDVADSVMNPRPAKIEVTRKASRSPLRKATFKVGDVVTHKKFGQGTVTFVGSGPKGDKVSVQFSNPVQAAMGPALVDPAQLRLVSAKARRPTLRKAMPGEVSWGDNPNFPTVVDEDTGELAYVAANSPGEGSRQWFVGLWDHSDQGLIVWADNMADAEDAAVSKWIKAHPGYWQTDTQWMDENDGEEPGPPEDQIIYGNGVGYVAPDWPNFYRELMPPARKARRPQVRKADDEDEYTDNNGEDGPFTFDQLSPTAKDAVRFWVAQTTDPSEYEQDVLENVLPDQYPWLEDVELSWSIGFVQGDFARIGKASLNVEEFAKAKGLALPEDESSYSRHITIEDGEFDEAAYEDEFPPEFLAALKEHLDDLGRYNGTLYDLLRDEVENMSSDEYIQDLAEANNYLFDAEGSRV